MRPSRMNTTRSAQAAYARLVGDEDDRGARLAGELGQELDDGVAGGGVEGAGGLVGQQELAGPDHGACRPRCAAAGRRRSRRGSGRAARRCPPRRAAARARSLASRIGTPSSSSGSITFSMADSDGTRLRRWNTNPTSVRRNDARWVADRVDRSRPATRTLPASGSSSAPARCSSVDLPQPLGPIERDELAGLDADRHVGQRAHLGDAGAVALDDRLQLEGGGGGAGGGISHGDLRSRWWSWSSGPAGCGPRTGRATADRPRRG